MDIKWNYKWRGNIMSKDVENLRNHERVLNHVDIIKDKLEHKNKIKVGLLEFHPYDCCPLSCLYCTYHRDKSAVFPFESMEKLKIFDPRAIVVSFTYFLCYSWYK